MPGLQLCCSVHPYHPVDTCQGAVNFQTVQCRREPAERNSVVEEAAVIPLLTYEEEEEEEAVFIRGVNTNEDPPDAHQAQHRPVQATGAEEEAVFVSVVNTNEDPPNAHQAQHRPVQATGAMSA